MRKVAAMKRRSRTQKVDSSTDDANKEELEVNGDAGNDKNTTGKRKGRSSKHSAENGKGDSGSGDEKPESSSEHEEEEEPEPKKRKAAVKKGASAKSDDDDDGNEDEQKGKGKKTEEPVVEEHETKKKKASKKAAAQSKKAAAAAAAKEEKDAKPEDGGDGEEEEDEESYEVESIVNDKKVGKTKFYLIRWKGYTSESDTWEPEHTLDCMELLKEYKESKSKKKPKKEEEYDENADYEVDRILEVHFKRDGKREFLVVWKGYPATEATWEPEENMACSDMIEKFMSKVEKAKTIDQRTLRAVRPPTERFTLTTKDTGRRISKRNSNKQRVRYVDCE